MRWRNPSHVLKDIKNEALPVLSSQDLDLLPSEPEDPISARSHGMSPSSKSSPALQSCSNHREVFKMPKLPAPRHLRHGLPLTPRTPRRSPTVSSPSTPRNQILMTPRLGDIPLTPSLFNLCSASPCLGSFSVDMLSTPKLFPNLPGKGVPDLLTMIDNDLLSPTCVERKVSTFDHHALCDDNIADYILDVSDDYTSIQSPGLNTKRRKSVVPVDSVRQVFTKGRSGKRVSAELERILKEERRIKEKERRKEKKRKKMLAADNTEIEPVVEDDRDTLQRKVKRCGRRTRSLVRACKEIGLANTDADIDAMFTSNIHTHQDEE